MNRWYMAMLTIITGIVSSALAAFILAFTAVILKHEFGWFQ